MGTRHRHADVIHAWAEGEEIQYFWESEWRDWKDTSCPTFTGNIKWRVKPKTVKKEGWVNVYPATMENHVASTSNAYATEMQADKNERCARIACVHITWEEEV